MLISLSLGFNVYILFNLFIGQLLDISFVFGRKDVDFYFEYKV